MQAFISESTHVVKVATGISAMCGTTFGYLASMYPNGVVLEFVGVPVPGACMVYNVKSQ